VNLTTVNPRLSTEAMAPYKIAVLDDYQGLSQTKFSKLEPGEFEVTYFPVTLPAYDRSDVPQAKKDELVQRLLPFQVICTMRERTPFPEGLINQLPNLKLLLTTGTRNNALSLPTFKSKSIPVAGTVSSGSKLSKTKGAGTDSTTEHCITLILSLARNIAADDANVKNGGWQSVFATGLSGKTLGVVGLGRLGVSTARIMKVAFGMKIVAWSSNLAQEAADEQAKSAGLPVADEDVEKTFKVVSKEELFRTADVVSVHLVLSDRSRGVITKDDLERMKSTAFLVNTSRGPLVVEQDLLHVLKEGKIAGAATDVFDIEPLPLDSEWRSHDWGRNGRSRVIVTPHMGYVEESSIGGWYEQQVANVKRWAKGEELDNVLA